MTDLELLFLVLGIIYVWECGWWARRGSVGFRTWLGKRWTVAQPSRLLGNQKAGLVLAPPLPPLGTLLGSHCFPLSLSSEAALSYVSPSIDLARRSPQNATLFRFEEVKRSEAKGKKVLLNDRLFLKAASPTFAAYLASVLDGLQKTKASGRQRSIEQLLDRTFDTKAVNERWQDYLESSSGLRQSTNLLFCYLFVLAPMALWRLGLNFTWVWLLAGLLACTLTIAVQFHHAHKRLYPQSHDERFSHFIIVLLSPASAIRAHDLLARPLMEPFHPLAVARVLCSEAEFKRFAQELLRELRFPLDAPPPTPSPLARTTESFSRELTLSRLERFLRTNGLRPEELLQCPLPSDQSCRSFCPRCLAQFTLQEGSCSDCESVNLVPFAIGPGRPKSPPPKQPAIPG